MVVSLRMPSQVMHVLFKKKRMGGKSYLAKGIINWGTNTCVK
jgi:hypothetical protein